MSAPALEFAQVSRVFEGSPPVAALSSVSFQLARGAIAALLGPSGSGKSTLLNLASGLDRPSQGEVRVGGQVISALSRLELCRFRRKKVGFVFQSYSLFPVLSAVENTEYTCIIRGDPPRRARERALEALAQVGLSEKASSRPGELSGGQQQRVAIARALAMEPEIVFADEPTANLDSETAGSLIGLLEKLNREQGTTFLIATHDQALASRATLQLRIRDGRLESRA